MLLDLIAGMDNVLWWHRIIERKGFCLNGGINYYSDFMVMTKRGRLVLVEFKGDDRDNSGSRAKLELGCQRQAAAGRSTTVLWCSRNGSLTWTGRIPWSSSRRFCGSCKRNANVLFNNQRQKNGTNRCK